MAVGSDAGAYGKLGCEIRDALASSLDLHEVFERSRPLLQRLLSADCSALAITVREAPQQLE